MAGYRKNKNRKRAAAIIVAAFLVAALLLGTIAPFFVRADVASPVCSEKYCD